MILIELFITISPIFCYTYYSANVDLICRVIQNLDVLFIEKKDFIKTMINDIVHSSLQV